MVTLMYHNLVPQPEPELLEVHYQVSVAAFARQIGRVASELLDPEDVQRTLQEGHPQPKGILLTFDDGAAGLSHAVEILTSHKARAVVFICPGQLERGLWFFRLAQDLNSSPKTDLNWRGQRWDLGGNRRTVHAALMRELEPLSCPCREDALCELHDALAPPPIAPNPSLRTADGELLRTLARSGCFLFANHSWSHPDLARLPASQVEEEIDCAQRWLEETGLPTLPWFAFPCGSYNDVVVDQVKRRGLVPFGADAWTPRADVLPRVGIYAPDAARWRFEAKLFLARSGLIGALHRARVRGSSGPLP